MICKSLLKIVGNGMINVLLVVLTAAVLMVVLVVVALAIGPIWLVERFTDYRIPG